MKIIPHGAAQEVTGSCHEIQANGKRIILDCGLFQGPRKESAVKNVTFDFDPATDLDAMVLSHAHMDHVGRVPLLWKTGYRGPIYSTYTTRDLAEVMLQDSAYIQEKDEEYFCKHLKASMLECDGPLYTQVDAGECMELFEGVHVNEWFNVVDGIRCMLLPAGHILGSTMMVLEITENGTTTRVGFSGDLGRSNLPIIPDPFPMPQVDVLICESTYGNRTHESIDTARGHLQEAITETAKKGGKLLIPAFSLERTQEIVYDMHILWDEKAIPSVPIFIDSPLATKVTDVFMQHPESYDQDMYDDFLSKHHNPFQFSLLDYTEDVNESKALNEKPGPMVIMAGSGMCEAGRIRHHLRNCIEDEKNMVLAVGYMAQHTLGARLMDPEVQEVKIFDKFYAKRAKTKSVDAYSGHADMNDLDEYITSVEGLKKLILVHGEIDSMKALATRMEKAIPGLEVHMPERDQAVEI